MGHKRGSSQNHREQARHEIAWTQAVEMEETNLFEKHSGITQNSESALISYSKKKKKKKPKNKERKLKEKQKQNIQSKIHVHSTFLDQPHPMEIHCEPHM